MLSSQSRQSVHSGGYWSPGSPLLEELLPDPLEEWEWDDDPELDEPELLDADPELEEPELLEGKPELLESELLEGKPELLEGESELPEGKPELLGGQSEPLEGELESDDEEELEFETLMGESGLAVAARDGGVVWCWNQSGELSS